MRMRRTTSIQKTSRSTRWGERGEAEIVVVDIAGWIDSSIGNNYDFCTRR